MNTLTIIALSLIFLSGIGAILLTIGQSISSSQDKSDIINNTKEENKDLKKELSEIKSERKKLAEELNKRNDELQEKSDYIEKYLTGGEGFPFIQIENFSTQDYNIATGMFNLEIISEFPMYNIRLNIYDYDLLESALSQNKIGSKSLITLQEFEKCRILKRQIEELTPPQTTYLYKKISLKECRYYIQIHARNNTFFEKVVSVIHNKNLSYAYQLYTRDGKLLKEEYGENISSETKSLLLKKLNTISLSHNFDIRE